MSFSRPRIRQAKLVAFVLQLQQVLPLQLREFAAHDFLFEAK